MCSKNLLKSSYILAKMFVDELSRDCDKKNNHFLFLLFLLGVCGNTQVIDMRMKDAFVGEILLVVWVTTNSLTAKAQTVSADTLPVPEFSVKHGFYQASFNVIVSAQTTNDTIKYTLDGSDPRTSSTALLQNSPAAIRIDPESTEGQRGKTPGVILRACALAPNSSASEAMTQTYLFVDKVGELSPDSIKPGPAWPNPTTSASPQTMDYGMDPDVLNDSRYEDVIDDALLAIPTISIVTDLRNLFASDI
jgi:hypothetical protein